MIAAFALTMVGTVSAYNEGDYAYNSTQRFKITGENLVTNGNFAESRKGWYGATDEDPLDADTWEIVEGAGPNGAIVVKSLAANADKPMCNKWQITEAGTYIVSLDIKTPNAVNTTILTAGSAAGTNAVDFFLNNDGSFTKVASTDEAPVINVAASKYIPQEEWTSVVFYFTADVNQYLVMNVSNLAAETQLTNIELHKANEVYDDRIAKNRIAWIKTLMEIPDFNVEAAKDAKSNLEEYIGTVEGALAEGALDDPNDAANYMDALETEAVEPFMSITSRRMNDKLTGTETATLTGTGKINRGDNNSLKSKFPNLDLTGGNWQHPANEGYLLSAIQGGYSNSGAYNAFNVTFPAGRYLITGEVRNASVGSSATYQYTYDLETVCKPFVGTDSTEITVSGEDYQRFYHIATIEKDGEFNAGIYWPGKTSGSAFFIKNVEVYAVGNGQDIDDKVSHIEAWNTFKAQYDAAASRRTTLSKMTRRNATDDTNWPWGQDSIANAKKQWDPCFNPVKSWVNENGEDAGIATTEELNEWAIHQNYILPDTTETSTDAEKAHYKRYSQYAVVRGYSDAITYVENLNKPFTDLANAIEAAKTTRNTKAYLSGDRDAYKTAILAALKTLKETRISTTDATRVADSTTLDNALKDLNTATEAFIATVNTTPFVDIDFSNPAVEIQEDGETASMAINGTLGRMLFTNFDVANSGNTNTNFTQGYGEELMDVLRVGNGKAIVKIDEANQPTDSEGIRFEFDFYHGSLSGRFAGVELQNAAGQRIAGFSVNRYNGSLNYNDFNNDENTGMDILKYATGVGSSSSSNAAICVASNKTTYLLTLDYLNKTAQGTIVNAKNGTCEGAAIPFRTDDASIEDFKVTQFVLISNYTNGDRRCWFDNLKITKFPLADVEEDITEDTFAPTTGIKNVETVKANDGAIYNLAGQKVSKNFKGLIIKNGKKYFVK